MNRLAILSLTVAVAFVTAQSSSQRPVTLNPCAATLCAVGTTCVNEGGRARCVSQGGSGNCTVANEEWRSCASCEPTCEKRDMICNKMCQPARCQCRTGFYRNAQGQCVTANDCDSAAASSTASPRTCRANEEYRECATACEPSCKTKDIQMACIAMCMPAACQCKSGYYRNEAGDCVTNAQCSSTGIDSSTQTPTSDRDCKKNERFASCSSMCEPQCGQYAPIPCILMCGPPRCQCKSGFYRSTNGKCISRAKCEKQSVSTPAPQPACKRNQHYTECSSACIPKCGEYGAKPCMLMCGPPKCECNQGFYLNNNGDCVSRAECDAQSSTPRTPRQADCNPNELFRECSSACEPKCGECNQTRVCPAVCGPAKCQCQSGFYRNSVGDCVNRIDCENDQAITCANIDCVSGMQCQMQDGKPKCVAAGTPSCNTVKCSSGYHCEVQNGAAKCVEDKKRSITCANVRCAGPCTDTDKGPVCGTRPTTAGTTPAI